MRNEQQVTIGASGRVTPEAGRPRRGANWAPPGPKGPEGDGSSRAPRAAAGGRTRPPADRQECVRTVACLAIELSNAMIAHDATLLQLVRDAYRLASANVKVEISS